MPVSTRDFTGGEDRISSFAPQQSSALRIAMTADSSTTVSLQQLEGAVSATWYSPRVEPHEIRRNDMGRGASIRFTLVASETGNYEIRFLCLGKTTPCSVRALGTGLRSASDADREHLAVEELLAHGIAIHRSTEKDARAGAFVVYDQVLERAQALNDISLERAALYWKARLSLETQRYAQGLAAAQQAVHLEPASAQTATQDPQSLAAAWKVEGYANAYLGNLDAAIDCYAHAADLYSALGDLFNNEVLEENMARAHRAMGQNGKAIDELMVALAEAQAMQDGHGITASLEELGNLHLARGELQQALDAYRQAQEALVKWSDDTVQAHVLNGTGHVYTLFGEYDQARDAFAQSVALWRKIKDPMGESYALDGQGFLSYTLQDFSGAIQRFHEALDLVQSLHLDRETAIILEELGEADQQAGDLKAANDAFEQSLVLARTLHLIETEADSIRSMGEGAVTRKDSISAQSNFAQAERLYGLLGGTPKLALLAGDQANLELSNGHLRAAEKYMQQALALIESSRKSIHNADYRSSYFSTQRNYYDLDIALLMRMDRSSPGQGYAARALEVSERARARALIDSLREDGIKIQSANADLMGRQRKLSDSIEAQSFLIEQASETEQGATDSARSNLLELQAQQTQLQRQIRAQDPAYASLVQGQTVSAEDLQHRLLDPETVLLEYWLGSEHSYLWAVTSSKIVSYRLPAAAALEKQAKQLYASLTARNLTLPSETIASRSERIRRADDQAQGQASALAAILIAPAEALIRRHSIVTVVAEGALNSVPFAALPLKGRRLVETHEIAFLPSASVLPQLRANRPLARPERIALIADPVFSAHDPRVKSSDSEAQSATTQIAVNSNAHAGSSMDAEDLTRSAGDIGMHDFPRLVYSRQEVQSIGRLLPAGSQWSAMDFAASRDAVSTLDWSQFTIAHFSTHALLDTVHPDLSGIVLSLVDSKGDPQDGFMRVRDIYNMSIPVQLVVLSACRTALGKEVRGEGVVGLARAFSHAGSQRVLATVWDVNDHATSELMTRFYRGLLQSGHTPTHALALAQRSLAREPRWRAPYFWASFVLQGDWKPSPTQKNDLERRR